MRVRMTCVLAVVVLLAGSCGGDDADDADDGASTSINAAASEFKFDPASWTVPAGEEFTIAFKNDGSVKHEWAVIKRGQDIESEAEFAEDKVLFEVEGIAAGESTRQKFTVDEVGTYQVICAIETHFDAGMQGALVVE